MTAMKYRSGQSLLLLVIFLGACLTCSVPSLAANPNRPAPIGAQPVANAPAHVPAVPEALIPGPLRSFERMAAISQQTPDSSILPFFALNVFTHGYGSSRDRQNGRRPTEYLVLLELYLSQATELQKLAGPTGVIRVTGCAQAEPLLDALGYRLRQPCGAHTTIETADANRAFLTVDSGFPLAQLEQALRSGKEFSYPFASSTLPLLFTSAAWTAGSPDRRIPKDDVVDALARDPMLARLYWAMSRLEPETRDYLEKKVGIRKLVPYAPILDFYGREICIRSGRVLVPGGTKADSAWQNLVGASPKNPARFVTLLLKNDEGWMAAYFDALSRIDASRQTYFTNPRRLRLFYEALRGDSVYPTPARPVFRSDPGLFLLVTDVQFDRDGQPHVPGGLEVWKTALERMKSHSSIVREWGRRARGWRRPEDLLTAMFAYSRVSDEGGPLEMYLMLTAIDRARPAGDKLRPQTASLLIQDYPRFHAQYLLFSEFHGLNDSSIDLFVRAAQHLDAIRSTALRANALGIFQAEIGLWQILARQREIPESEMNASFQRVIRPFAIIHNATELFVAGQNSFDELCRAATGESDCSQDEFVALLAGPNPSSAIAAQVRQTIANHIDSVLTDQRLVSLDTLFALGTGFQEMAQGKAKAGTLLPLTAQLNQYEYEMPQPIFSASQVADWSYGLGNNSHTTSQEHIDWAKVLKGPHTPQQLVDARGLLAPFLRDSLVGLNYAYYEPPGEQMARNDPLFVRTHDFSGTIAEGGSESWATPFLVGRGWTSGAGAHLAGSLADLPYVLADVEQGFIVPKNIQALIWRDMVPTLLTDAVVPRWWGISRDELHAVALYQEAGEELLTASTQNPRLRAKVMDILSGRMMPARQARIEADLSTGNTSGALAQVTPADTFFLTAIFRQKYPRDAADWGPAGKELEALSLRDPGATSVARLSKDFGVPHVALDLTYSRQLLNVKPFPTFMGYASRLLGESWESDNLYWARVADQAGYAPAMLNILVPQLTRDMIVNIFATYPGDWPALLRALRQTGEEFHRGEIAALPKPVAARADPTSTQQ
jgi:hypothetical protein